MAIPIESDIPTSKEQPHEHAHTYTKTWLFSCNILASSLQRCHNYKLNLNKITQLLWQMTDDLFYCMSFSFIFRHHCLCEEQKNSKIFLSLVSDDWTLRCANSFIHSLNTYYARNIAVYKIDQTPAIRIFCQDQTSDSFDKNPTWFKISWGAP